jgi:type II secretory pathway component PulF
MPNFHYKAVDAKGKVILGQTLALDETDVDHIISRNGLSLIQCEPVNERSFFLGGSSTIKPRTIIEFFHRLGQTLEIGLPILSALDENSRYLPSIRMRKICSELKLAVEGGRSFHDALSHHPKVFSRLDLAVIRMGEQTGTLPECLKQIAIYLKWKEDLRHQIRKAAIYPSFVLVAIFAVIGVWVGYVLPQMVKVLLEMNVVIPWATLTLLEVSHFLQENMILLLAGLAVSSVLFIAYYRTTSGRLWIDQWILKVPLLGPVFHNVGLARLGHNFSTMFSAGMPISQIFTTLGDHGLGNRYLEQRLSVVFNGVESGESLAAAFETANGFPGLMLGAIRNGESTGTLDLAFKRLGEYYDEEVKRTVQSLISVIEPLAIVGLGVVFGLIVLSILLPLYDVMGSMGKAY